MAKKIQNKKTPNTSEQHVSTPEEIKTLTPVVAIGASSGGLQALSELLENLEPGLDMAYVIIQHLSPTHDSILPVVPQ